MKNILQEMMPSNLNSLSSEDKAKAKSQIERTLMASLAAYVIIRREDPICLVLDDLFQLEIATGRFLGETIPILTKRSNLRGALANTLSVIPINPALDAFDEATF